MGARDRILLLGTLASLLERVPTTSVRLVVFNLDQQRELYRQDGFSTPGFNEVARSLIRWSWAWWTIMSCKTRGGMWICSRTSSTRKSRPPAVGRRAVSGTDGAVYRQDAEQRPGEAPGIHAAILLFPIPAHDAHGIDAAGRDSLGCVEAERQDRHHPFAGRFRESHRAGRAPAVMEITPAPSIADSGATSPYGSYRPVPVRFDKLSGVKLQTVVAITAFVWTADGQPSGWRAH